MKKSYENIVIGGGLEGLVLATQLSQNGREVLLVEASQKLGHSLSSSDSPIGPLTNSLFCFSDNEENQTLLKFAQTYVSPTLNWTSQTHESVHFEKGRFENFVGFGEKKVPQYEWLQNYLSPRKLSLNLSPQQWISALHEKATFDIELNTEVTEIKSEDTHVTSLVTNGKTEIAVQNLFLTTNPLKLNSLFKNHQVLNKTLQKLNGSEFWTTLNVDFVHPTQVTEKWVLMFYMDLKRLTLFASAFLSKIEFPNDPQASHWITFLTQEEASLPENSGNSYKEIKKQIKRAYPTALENLSFEKISVFANSHGKASMKLTEDGRLPGYENLWLCSSKFSNFTNPLSGALDNLRERVPKILENISNSSDLREVSKSPQTLKAPP